GGELGAGLFQPERAEVDPELDGGLARALVWLCTCDSPDPHVEQGECVEWFHHHQSGITCPSSRVPSSSSTFGSIVSGTRCTRPSAKQNMTSPGCRPPNFQPVSRG